jgi:hypothetical protein
MRKTYFIYALVALSIVGCQPFELSPEEVYINSVQSVRLNEPTDMELPLGATLDVKELLRVTYKDSQSAQTMSIPDRAVRVLVNESSSANPVYTATTPGTHTIQVRIGEKASNAITVKVLPFSLVRIPVVFHTVNSTLSSSQINRLLQGMTDAFRNRWNPYNGSKDKNAVDSFIEFYAADVNPSGRALAVPGLDAVTSSRQSFTSEQAVDNAWGSYWNPKRYLNVWIYSIDRDESLSGFAYISPVTRSLAGSRLISASRINPDLPYGIFYNKDDVNNVRSSTLAHEAGHMLGLHHVFDGNGDEHRGCSSTDPDYCADTPFYDRKSYMDSYRTLRAQRQACDGTSYESNNIMDYYLSYENTFTRQQRERIRHTITYGQWVPQPAGAGSRQGAEDGYIKKPDDYRFVPPVICAMEKE